MLKIGYFSKLSRISIRMLRHYDEVGILVPQKIDDFNGYRYYAEEQLIIAGRIITLRNMGFNIATIKEILINYNNSQALTKFLGIKRLEMQTEIKEKKQKLLLLETTIDTLRKDETAMNYNVTIKTLPERYIASVRQIIPSYEQEGILWNILMKETCEMNMQMEEPCYGLAVFHDEGHKDKNPDVEIQICVKGNYKNTKSVVFKTVSEIEFASAVVKGSYDQLSAVHRSVAGWVRDNGYEFNGNMFCIYHVSPAQTNNPDEYVSEVCYPIKKK